MKEMQLHDYQVGKASSGAWAPDYAARIEFCQSKIREMKHLKFDNNCHLVNARGDRLSSDCVRLMETCQNLKKKYIKNILSNENFVTAPNPRNDFTALL